MHANIAGYWTISRPYKGTSNIENSPVHLMMNVDKNMPGFISKHLY